MTINECWNWKGSVDRDGYGRLTTGHLAHRDAYQKAIGPIPDGLELDHLCKNKRCVRPTHLEPVTHQENMRRWASTITHCKHGHEYTTDNTYNKPDGTRDCRACIRARVRSYKRRKAA